MTLDVKISYFKDVGYTTEAAWDGAKRVS